MGLGGSPRIDKMCSYLYLDIKVIIRHMRQGKRLEVEKSMISFSSEGEGPKCQAVATTLFLIKFYEIRYLR